VVKIETQFFHFLFSHRQLSIVRMQKGSPSVLDSASFRPRYFSTCCAIFLFLVGSTSAFHPFFRPLGTNVAVFAADSSDSMVDDPQTAAVSTTTDNSSNGITDKNTCESGDMRFGKFIIPEASIFCRSSRTAAFVNLRPIVPGHVLIVPYKIVPYMADLEDDDYNALFCMVRTVQKALKKAYPQTTAFNVAIQDGKAAGQSIPHVHVHVLPRSGGDFERNDDVYDALEAWAPTEVMASSKEKFDISVPDDADRIDRTPQAMSDEASMYRKFLKELE